MEAVENTKDEILDFLNVKYEDIIFQGRNKAYGAYALRQRYTVVLTKSNILVISLFLIGTLIPQIVRLVKDRLPEEELIATEVVLSEPPPLDAKAPPPPPPPIVEPLPLRKPTIAFVAPKVKKDEEVIEEMAPPDVNKLKDMEISTKTQEGVEEGIPEGIIDEPEAEAPPVLEISVEKEPEKPFVIVEQMPTYPDGEAAMLRFIYNNIRYPAIAKENGVDGTVVVQFVIETDGSISSVKTMRDIGAGCGEEAMRVVKMMPKWNPGKQRGRAVRVIFNLPVKFALE